MVPYIAKALREKLKAAGERWDPEERLWRVRYGAIRGDVGLVERIVRDEVKGEIPKLLVLVTWETRRSYLYNEGRT